MLHAMPARALLSKARWTKDQTSKPHHAAGVFLQVVLSWCSASSRRTSWVSMLAAASAGLMHAVHNHRAGHGQQLQALLSLVQMPLG
jgi:hypothetical protein